jgi:hypothetical protein
MMSGTMSFVGERERELILDLVLGRVSVDDLNGWLREIVGR